MQQKDKGGVTGGCLLWFFSSVSRTEWRLICILLCLLVSQQGNFIRRAVQTGTLMNAKFAFLCKILSLYYFWICNYMASTLVFLLMTVFTRPAFAMLLNLRLLSLILELFLSLVYVNLVLPTENWPQLQLTEFKTNYEISLKNKEIYSPTLLFMLMYFLLLTLTSTIHIVS